MPGPLDQQPIGVFLDELGARTPTPGGGAVAGLIAAISAALARMVVNYSIGRKDLAAHEPDLRADADELAAHARAFVELADADAQAYAALNSAQKTPADAADRDATIARAALAATRVPVGVLHRCALVAERLESLTSRSNRYLLSDLAIAAIACRAAAHAAAWNIRANLPTLRAQGLLPQLPDASPESIDRVLAEIDARAASTERACGRA